MEKRSGPPVPRVVAVEYMKAEDAVQTLKQIAPVGVRVRLKEGQDELVITSDDQDKLEEMLDVLGDIDRPSGSGGFNRFYKLRDMDAGEAAHLLRNSRDDWSVRFVAVPDPVTDRVFVMGTREEGIWIEAFFKGLEAHARAGMPEK